MTYNADRADSADCPNLASPRAVLFLLRLHVTKKQENRLLIHERSCSPGVGVCRIRTLRRAFSEYSVLGEWTQRMCLVQLLSRPSCFCLTGRTPESSSSENPTSDLGLRFRTCEMQDQRRGQFGFAMLTKPPSGNMCSLPLTTRLGLWYS